MPKASPADVIVEYLQTLGTVVRPGDADGTRFPAVSYSLPPDGERFVAVMDNGAVLDGRTMDDGRRITHPRIVVYIRCSDKLEAQDKGSEIEAAFDAIGVPMTFPGGAGAVPVWIGNENFVIRNASVQTPLQPLGQEPSTQWFLFNINVKLTIEQTMSDNYKTLVPLGDGPPTFLLGYRDGYFYRFDNSQIAGSTLPSGGTTGQALTKSSNADYAVAWTTLNEPSTPDPELPAGALAVYQPNIGMSVDATGNFPIADGNPLGRWADRSGNACDIVAPASTAPIYLASGVAGKPCLEFGGSKVLSIPASVTFSRSAGWTILFVTRHRPQVGSNGVYFAPNGTSLNFFVPPSTHEHRLYDGIALTVAPAQYQAQPILWHYDGTTLTVRCGRYTYSAARAIVGGTVAGANVGTDLTAKIEAIAIYGAGLESVALEQLWQYGQWVATGGQEVSTKLIVVDGNSISSLEPTSWWQVSRRDLSDYEWQVVAVPSRTTNEMIADATVRVTPILNARAWTKKVLVAWEITNAVYFLSKTAAEAVADLWTYTDARRAQGFKVVVAPMLPRVAISFSVVQDVYAIVRAQWESHADAFADFTVDPLLYADGAETNLDVFLDGVHPTVYGSALLAPYFTAAIQTAAA